jgi:hypothetical protein
MEWLTSLAVALLTFAATRAAHLPPRPRAKTTAEIRAEWLQARPYWPGGR